MKNSSLIALCLVSTLATAADIPTGKYVSTVSSNAGPATLELRSLQGDQVAAMYYWPARKRSENPCAGEHLLAGSLNGTTLELADAPRASVLQGCEIQMHLEWSDQSLKGTVNGAPREYKRD